MWRLILKNQELATTSLGGTLDWENEAIPDERDDDCKKWLKGLYDILNKHQDISYKSYPTMIDLDKIPENLACAIKEYYLESPNGYNVSTNLRDIRPLLEKHGVVGEYSYIYIDTYFDDYFSVDIDIYDPALSRRNRTILSASIHFDWYEGSGPLVKYFKWLDEASSSTSEKGFKNPYQRVSRTVSKVIQEVEDGTHEETKKICSFIKEYSNYINKPDVIEYFLSEYAIKFRKMDMSNRGYTPEQQISMSDALETDKIFEDIIRRQYF